MEIKMTSVEYHSLCDSYGGVCESCGEVHIGGIEPDAEGYRCDACGEDAVMGAEDALVAGIIEITA